MSNVPMPTQEPGDTRLADGPRRRLRVSHALPLILFVALTIALGWGLTQNPREIPSVLIGKPVPEFTLPPVQGRPLGLASAHLKGSVSLVNVFASWCTACRDEHPIFMQLKVQDVIPIHGLNYKDRPDDAARWLDMLGDPYARTGADRDGRVAIDWGVYGVPETFVIGKDGRIAYKHIGAVTPEILQTTIMPLIEALRRGETEVVGEADGETARAGPERGR